MKPPEYVLKDDIDLYVKELRLAGYDPRVHPGEIWVKGWLGSSPGISLVQRTDGHWVPVSHAVMRFEDARRVADQVEIPK